MSAPLLALLLLAAPAERPPTVAISYFDNNTGKSELDPLAKGLADMLITDLSQVQAVQIVERERLNAALAELKLSRGRFIDPKTAQKLGRGLAATFIMVGGYTLAGDTLRIDARLFKVETGAVVASERVEGSKDEFFALEKELVDLLVRALALKVAPAERAKLRANPTQSFTAWEQYSVGLDAGDKGDHERARAAFERALAADPNYRAARTASERLAAIFARADRQRVAQADVSLKGLDPKAADFVSRVDSLFLGLDSTKTEQLRRKLGLLTWLGERDVLACATAGPAAAFCRHAHEVLQVAFRLTEDPDMWDAIPKVCERFIHQLPGDRAILSYCETMLKVLRYQTKRDPAEARRGFATQQEESRKTLEPDDWRMALLENHEAMRKVVRLYARSARRP